MQPYFLPYIGYFQLISCVDVFVFFDDVNYINKGWINRNQLLQKNKPIKFTIPLLKATQNKLINEIELADYNKWRKDFLRMVEMNYGKAPQFSFVFRWLNDLLHKKNFLLISELAEESVMAVANLLELPSKFLTSASITYNQSNNLNGSGKILELCEFLGADEYINPKNGKELYEQRDFLNRSIKLGFINTNELSYPQFRNEAFVANLSILDVLMFNDVKEAMELMKKYDINK
ncbi:MAG: WbqC family protein [Ferruginibacter sp.]|nr:WbqC family protein [Ferruginibacter sp.]